MKRISLLVGFVLLAGLFIASECSASPITFEFTGTVTSFFSFDSTPIPDGVYVGAPVVGSYTFESTLAPTGGIPNYSDYWFLGDPYGFGAEVGDLSFWEFNSFIVVENDFYGSDAYDAQTDPSIHGPDAFIANIFLYDPTSTAFSSTSLPLVAPNLSLFDYAAGSIHYIPLGALGTSAGYTIGFDLNSLTGGSPVPEPTSLVLLASGAFGIGIILWRRRK